jgi:WD40 repeat protein
MRSRWHCLALTACLTLTWGTAPGRAAAQVLDLHGDPLPPDAVARLGTVRLGPAGPHFTVAFTPDSKRLVIGCGPVFLCDAATGKTLRRFDGPERGYVSDLDISRDGALLATAGSNHLITLWVLATGKRLREMSAPMHYAQAVAFAPDGKTVVSGCMNQTLRWWEIETGKELRLLKTEGQEVHRIAFSPDGKTMATAGRSSTERGKALCLWDVATGQQRWLPGHAKDLWNEGGVIGIAFSRDGKLLASAGADHTVRVWDVAAAREVHCFKGHTAVACGVAFDVDGKRLFSVGHDANGGRVWDLATGKELFQLAEPGTPMNSVALSPDGKTLATGGFVVRLWDPATGKERLTARGHRDDILTVAVVPGRPEVLTAGIDGVVRRWETPTGKEKAPAAEPGRAVTRIAVSPDGKLLALGDRTGKVQLLELATGMELHQLKGLGASVHSLAFLSDGSNRLAGGDRRALCLWDSATGKMLHNLTLMEERTWVNCWAITTDGKWAAAGNNPGKIHIWDLATGKDFPALRGHGQISALAFSADGKQLVSGDWSGHLILWDRATGKAVWDVEAHESIITQVAFSPDGHSIAVANYDKTVSLWETATGQLRRRFGQHEDLPFALAFAERGRLLVSGGRDCAGLVWDVTGGLPPAKLSPKELDGLWNELIGADAAKAHQAIWKLVGSPAEALPYLQQQLQTPVLADLKRLAKLIDDLDSPKAEVMDKAAKELEVLGSAVGPLLREVLAGKPSDQARKQVELLLKKMEKGGFSLHQVRQLRALEAIEQIGGDAALKTLQALAEDRGEALLMREAAAALARSR